MGTRAVLADSHIHLFRNGFHGDLPDHHDLVAYEGYRKDFGIDRALVVGYEGHERYQGNNAYLRDLASEHPWMAPVRYVGGSSGDWDDLEPEFVGYAIYLDDWEQSTDAATKLQARASHLREGPLISINGTPEMIRLAASSLHGFDSSKILISHLGLPGRPATSRGDALEKLAPIIALADALDVFVKVSAPYAIDSDPQASGSVAYVEVLLDFLGPDKLVWGSDFAPALDHQSVDVTFSLASRWSELFGEAERRMVLHDNLVALLGG